MSWEKLTVVATHVAFLDEGKLLFQESMSELMGRFREVHVTLEQAAMAPREAPKEWLQVRAMGNVLTFVDTRFDPSTLSEQIHSQIAGVKETVVAADGIAECFHDIGAGGTRRPSVKKGERKWFGTYSRRIGNWRGDLSWRSRRSTG